MEYSLVTEYDEVVNNVKSFNQGLGEGEKLENHLSYFRAWYYIPELDMVGPSKFIGYKEMAANRYMNSDDLDGKDTVVILGQWFNDLEEDAPELMYIEQLTRRLLSKYNKNINRVAWFNAPIDWRVDGTILESATLKHTEIKAGGGNKPIVEVFWRAYLSLYPEDQQMLAKRIIEYRK